MECEADGLRREEDKARLLSHPICIQYGCPDTSTGWYIDNLAIFKIKLWTSDGAGKRKNIFFAGDPIKYHLDVWFTGTPKQNYKILASGEASNVSGPFWEKPLPEKIKFGYPGAYKFVWSSSVSKNATSGSDARVCTKVTVEGVGVTSCKVFKIE